MIVYTYLRTREDGEHLVQSVSDRGVYLMKMETGELLPDPIDVAERYFDEKAFEVKFKPKYYHYIETDEEIKPEAPVEPEV